MVEVKELYIYYYDSREVQFVPGQKPILGIRKQITVIPSGPTPLQMKTDIAKALKKVLDRVYKYYITAKVERSDGTTGYRTLTKTIFPKQE